MTNTRHVFRKGEKLRYEKQKVEIGEKIDKRPSLLTNPIRKKFSDLEDQKKSKRLLHELPFEMISGRDYSNSVGWRKHASQELRIELLNGNCGEEKVIVYFLCRLALDNCRKSLMHSARTQVRANLQNTLRDHFHTLLAHLHHCDLHLRAKVGHTQKNKKNKNQNYT